MMLPAGQGFETCHLAIAKTHNRLIMKNDVIVVDGGAKIIGQNTPLPQLLVHTWFEHAEGAASFVFGPVEGKIGPGQQFFGILGIRWIDGNARAGTD